MTSGTSLPKALLAKRQKELDQMGKTGKIPLADVFRMVYENISENPLAKEFAPEEVKKLRASIDEVQNNINAISRIVQVKSGKGPGGPGGKGPQAKPTEQTARKSPPTKRRRARK